MITKINEKLNCNKKLYLILFVGVLLRVCFLGAHPIGLHHDEAYMGYETWALLNYGMDSNCYSWPVYFISWSSGMNVLYSYLSIPFVALFGLNQFSIRIVQALFGCLSLPLFYALLRKFLNENESLFGLLLLAINPWHVSMSRWALESNLAPFFVLLTTFLLCEYLEGNKKALFFAALSIGLSLYSYAILWMFLPLYLLAFLFVAIYTGKFKPGKEIIPALITLILLATPLFLFLAVNYGLLPEMNILCFSIPKLPDFRGGEVGGSLIDNIILLLDMLLRQNGYPGATSIQLSGNYYLLLTPFIIYGFIICLKRFMELLKTKEFNYESIIFIWFICAIIIASTIPLLNTNRANYLHMPIVVFSIIGILKCVEKLPKAKLGITLLLFVSFLTFIIPFSIFNNGYRSQMAYDYADAIKFADQYREENGGDLDILVGGIYHSHILFDQKPSPKEFYENMERDPRYGIDPLSEVIRQHFTHYKHYVFEIKMDEIPKANSIYILPNYSAQKLVNDYDMEILYSTSQYSVLK